jgi:alkylation response protein AidB-like acyl-CoA dehydrogenase
MLANIELEKVIITGGYLGAAQATLDEMLAFAKTRHAFKVRRRLDRRPGRPRRRF